MMAEPDRYQIERDSINKQLAIFKKSLNVIKKDPQLSRLLGQANSERNRQQSAVQGQNNDKKSRGDVNNNNQMHNNYINNPQQSNNDNSGNTRNINGNNDREMTGNFSNLNQGNHNQMNKPQQGNLIQGTQNMGQTTAVKSKPKLILFKQENKE